MYRLLLLLSLAVAASAQDRPNILWISIEDTGPQVEPYDLLARTPNIKRLAAEGVTFLHAFSHSPVCAPTRSGIITGMYPSTIGTQHMRSDMAPPAYIKAFPEYLRKAGYYTTNNVKTDYNFPSPLTAWDESSATAHWKNRPDEEQPFFAVFNLTTSHESAVGRQFEARMQDSSAKIHDAARLILPPYYPDTPKVREAWAAYYDVVTITDRRIGELLAELDDAGLRDDTLVVFWGDHGAGLARGKRWLYDSGVRVPLVARWPGRIEPRSVRVDLVQFLDLAPTMLAIGGVEKPEHMQGRIILGPQTEPAPEYLFHARDRMDERYDMIRAVRSRQYKYIRNFESHKPWLQFMRTPSRGPIYLELVRVQDAGGLSVAQQRFVGRAKPLEELYDVVADPYELNNLAGGADHERTLETMRDELIAWMKRTEDKGLVPEPELYRTMFPDNQRPQAEKPVAATLPEPSGTLQVSFLSDEGASIAYTRDAGDEARWQVYAQPLVLEPGETVRAKAVRLGYADSAEIQVRN